jgi:CNT family concentrative nucleoside transporter
MSIVGLVVLMFLAWLISSDKKNMNFRLILTGVGLQIVFAVLILWTTPGKLVFEAARVFVAKAISFSDAGAAFVFGPEHKQFFFAFSVLPTIIFVSAVMAVLFHLGVMQRIVKVMAKIMVKVMDVSGSESLAASANVFVGQTEAPLVIKPYLKTMTNSELMAMMTGGMATVAGGVMAAYASMGADAGHLLAASIMSAPASLVIAKIILPEGDESPTKGAVHVDIPKQDANVLDAACRGGAEGLHLALNVGAMLIAFIALVGLVNWSISWIQVGGQALTLEQILGWVFSPLAFIMGIESKDILTVGGLLGQKTILNEFVAYLSLIDAKEVISERSFNITTYALCGFANFSSIAIQIGGIGALVPSRRKDFAKIGLKAMIGGTLAAFMTATIAGILI